MLQHKWALWSGFLGATASCFIKMGVGGKNSSPLLHFVHTYICERPMTQAWLADLDEVLLRGIHGVLGELMIKYRINLMPYWKIVRLRVIEEVAVRLHLFEVDYCELFIVLPVRIVCIIAMLITNVYMIASFLRGIQESGSVVGTSLSTAANFASSAIYGRILWHEQMNGRWFLGFSCVLIGVMILSSETTAAEETTNDDKTVNDTDASATDIRTRIKMLEDATNDDSNVNNSGTDITTRIKRFEERNIDSSSRPVTPPAPLEASRKTRDCPKIADKDIIKTKVVSLRTSFSNNENCSPRYELPATTPTFRNSKKFTPRITPSPEQVCNRIPLKPTNAQPSSPLRRTKEKLKPESALDQFYNFDNKSLSSRPNLINRSFVNECALCDGALFDKSTGDSKVAIADLSLNTCFHLFHSRCLKQASKSYRNACPICEKPLAMWTASKQAAQFPGFWLERVENFLRANRAPQDTISGKDVCLPASTIRDYFQQVNDLTESQKLYIQDDPMGMDRGLQAALEWGGYVDCNLVSKGHVGFSKALRTRGIWKYDPKKDDLWLWDWGSIHPRQRCDQCQLIKRPLPIECQGCRGSSEAAFYCSELCAKRDRQRHKQTCDAWKAHGPKL
jgi:hypothetical protein